MTGKMKSLTETEKVVRRAGRGSQIRGWFGHILIEMAVRHPSESFKWAIGYESGVPGSNLGWRCNFGNHEPVDDI